MFAQPCRGRAWRGCPKPRRRGWLRSNRRMPSCDAEPVSVSGAPGGHCQAGIHCFGETSELRLWAYKKRAFQMVFALSLRWTSTRAGWDGRRSLASNGFDLPHCDLCEPVCSSSGPRRSPAHRTRRSPRIDPDSAPSTRRPGGVPRAAAGDACQLVPRRARSGSDGRRRRTCSRCRSHALRHDTEWPLGPVTASAPDVGWGSPPPAGRNAHSTPANTPSPETRWRLPEWSLSPDASASPNDPAQLENCVQCALSLAANRPKSNRFPVLARPAPVVSAGLPCAVLPDSVRAAVVR